MPMMQGIIIGNLTGLWSWSLIFKRGCLSLVESNHNCLTFFIETCIFFVIRSHVNDGEKIRICT